jgi:molybdate transport system ATP-binding protein
MADPTTSDIPRLGAIVYSGDFEIEPVLGAVRDRLLARGGLRLGGVVPRFGEVMANGRQEMILDDVVGGASISISQELGAGADSCILDVDGLTRARMAILAAVDAGVDLVLVGKFAKQEAAGHGVREEIGAALAADIPTLVALRDGQLDNWRAFAGDDWQPLAPEVEPILAWVEKVTGA